ncbi:MAG: hypothetical protein ACREJV_08910 [Candidatus Rokuibacteriota bacterium]
MNCLAHPALIVALFARVAGVLALVVAAGGLAFAEEPAAMVTATPFQAIPPVLATPPVAASVPYEAELIEADPERKNRRRMDQIERLEDFERIDLTRTERFEGVERPERFEPAAGALRPDRIERQEKIERPERIERVEKIERPEKVERVEKVERPERRERLERIIRLGRD